MANFNFNKVILGGRLTSDPELKTTAAGISVTTFTVAVNRRGSKDNQQTDFLSVTAWRQTAEFITRYFHKGSNICVTGAIQTRSWEKDGQKMYATEIVADEAFFVDSKDDKPIMANPPVVPTVIVTENAQREFEDIGDQEELAF